jgi:hypothetical protein
VTASSFGDALEDLFDAYRVLEVVVVAWALAMITDVDARRWLLQDRMTCKCNAKYQPALAKREAFHRRRT